MYPFSPSVLVSSPLIYFCHLNVSLFVPFSPFLSSLPKLLTSPLFQIIVTASNGVSVSRLLPLGFVFDSPRYQNSLLRG